MKTVSAGLRLLSVGMRRGGSGRFASSDVVETVPSEWTPFPKPATTADKELQFDQVTHTGQAWDQEDYRLARFIKSPKQVNPNIAMHLIAKVAPTAVEGRTAVCDGGHDGLGHPKVYINLDKPGNHACGYCGLRFYQQGQPHDGSEHIQV